MRKLRQKYPLPFTEIKILTQAVEERGNLAEGPSAWRVAAHGGPLHHMFKAVRSR